MGFEEIVGKYVCESMAANQYLYHYQFTDKFEYDLQDNERIITIKFNIEESNGWHIKKGQVVDLVMVNEKESPPLILENVVVQKIFNDQLDEIELPFYSELVPQYVSFRMKDLQYLLYLENKKHTTTYILVK